MTGTRKLKNLNATAFRVRLSVSDKHAIVLRLHRLGAGGTPLAAHVRAIAECHGVSTKSVYRWLNDTKLNSPSAPEISKRPRFDISVDHLTVLADERNAKDAFKKLREADVLDCSYPTFARALKRADPALVAAALAGFKGLASNRVYLKTVAPHRGHTYNLDHTKLDLYVWASHKHSVPMRPFVTVVVDSYSSLLWAFAWYRPVNGDMVAAALAEVCTGRDYHGVRIGGQPEQVVMDNAGEHFAPSMVTGIAALGLIASPTSAYSSWQNGKAERAVGLINERLSNKAPGATNAGRTRTGAPRHGASLPGHIKPEDIWTARAFETALREVVEEINTTISVDRLGGMTRLEAYAADPTERRELEPEIARLAMMTTGDITHKATKAGLRFKGRDYVSHGLRYGEKYLIRYLPTVRDFIEVFSTANEFVCTAWVSEDLPEGERSKFMAARARQERDALAIEAGVVSHRRHKAALANANVDYGYDEGEAERFVDTLPGRDPEEAKTVVKPRRKQPRVPVTDTSDEEVDAKDTVAFLADRFPGVLPPTPQKEK